MTIEVPVLRLGCGGGFNEAQQERSPPTWCGRPGRCARNGQVASFPDAGRLVGGGQPHPGAARCDPAGGSRGFLGPLGAAGAGRRRPPGGLHPAPERGGLPARGHLRAVNNRDRSVAVLNQFSNWLQNMLSAVLPRLQPRRAAADAGLRLLGSAGVRLRWPAGRGGPAAGRRRGARCERDRPRRGQLVHPGPWRGEDSAQLSARQRVAADVAVRLAHPARPAAAALPHPAAVLPPAAAAAPAPVARRAPAAAARTGWPSPA